MLSRRILPAAILALLLAPAAHAETPKRLWYLMRFDPGKVPEMTGADLQLRGTRQDFDPQTAQPIVLIDFTGKGEDKFRDITRAEAQRGKLLYNTQGGAGADPDAFNQHFAIVLDREIQSWPSIDFNDYPNGISGGNTSERVPTT